MSASIITFANLGSKRNLKTPDIEPVVSTFAAAGELEQVICLIGKGATFSATISAIPTVLRYLLRIGEQLSILPDARTSLEKVFDYCAALRARRVTVSFLHGGYFLKRTAKKLHARGTIVVDIAPTSSVQRNVELERQELRALQVSAYEGLYAKLLRTYSPYPVFDYVITMSEFAKDSYVQMGISRERIFVASPDVDTRRFVPTENLPGKFRVLYIAHTTPLKGLQYLLDAWEQLALTDAELCIAGGFSDMPNDLKKRYGDAITRNPTITKLENVDRPEDLYRTASVFVFPSLTEGFGRVTLEAMACGLPVITTEHARGIVEDGKTGFVVPIRDAGAIKEKLEYLYHHRDIAKEMGREARRAVEQKKPFGEAIYAIYKEILAREGTTHHE